MFRITFWHKTTFFQMEKTKPQKLKNKNLKTNNPKNAKNKMEQIHINCGLCDYRVVFSTFNAVAPQRKMNKFLLLSSHALFVMPDRNETEHSIQTSNVDPKTNQRRYILCDNTTQFILTFACAQSNRWHFFPSLSMPTKRGKINWTL